MKDVNQRTAKMIRNNECIDGKGNIFDLPDNFKTNFISSRELSNLGMMEFGTDHLYMEAHRKLQGHGIKAKRIYVTRRHIYDYRKVTKELIGIVLKDDIDLAGFILVFK